MFAGISRPEKFHLNVFDLSLSGMSTKEKKKNSTEEKKLTLQQVLQFNNQKLSFDWSCHLDAAVPLAG